MDINALINKAAETENHSEAKKGGDFERIIIPAGRTVGRFIEYIELGKHVEEYQGKPKPSAEQVRVTFEFTHPKHRHEIEVEGGKKEFNDRISITMPKSQSEKAKFYKLFKVMAYGREDKVHMAQMLGEAFVFDVKHNIVEKNGAKVTYANIYVDGQWHIQSPVAEDPITGNKTDLSPQIPAAISPLKIFLWSNPTKETWDSLFIDGTRTEKVGDVEREVSKNWLQETILSATDFGGSALEQMLAGVDNLPTTESAQEAGAQTSKEASNAEAHANPQVKTTATIPAEGAAAAATQTVATATQGSAQDALAMLGLQ